MSGIGEGAAAAAKPPAAEPSQATQYVCLVSAEGFEFVIEREAAENSRMLADMLAGLDSIKQAGGDFFGGGDAAATAAELGLEREVEPSNIHTMHRIPLDMINAAVLDIVCQYLSEKRCAREGMSDFKQLRSLDPTKAEDQKLVLETLLAADYLDC